jgi:leader peptidase (prepilin peptidase)/N-methyltransferase
MLATEELWQLAIAPFVGSFAGTAAVRLAAGQSFICGRSACRNCGYRLRPRDLVPLVSWTALRGRCRACGAPISLLYPVSEIAALSVALAAAAGIPEDAPGWATCLLGWWLLTLALTDVLAFLLPDCLTLPLAGAGLVEAALCQPAALADRLIGLVVGYSAPALLAVVYRRLRGREGLGRGDWKLMAAIGAWVSWQALPAVVMVASAAALGGALLGLFGRPIAPTARVPFGAFLCIAAWAVWLGLV